MFSMRLTVIILCIGFFTTPGLTQYFEGTILMKVMSEEVDHATLITIKGERSIREVRLDSSESLKIIEDRGLGVITMLRQKDDLKYGFKRYQETEEIHTDDYEEDQTNISMEVTQEAKLVGEYGCVKIIFKTANYQASAWVTLDLHFPLSEYFPEILKAHDSDELRQLRKAVDNEGFIMEYDEINLQTGKEVKIEMEVFEREIPDHEFYYSSEFHVLDREGMQQLFREAQQDPEKKKQWDEFYQLFGKKS